jgi:hypothetical protein
MSQRQLSSVSFAEQLMLGAAALGLVVMLSFPAARTGGDIFGWVPFWLLALPLSAWGMARALRQRSRQRNVRGMALQPRQAATVHDLRSTRLKMRAGAVRGLSRAA